MQVRQKRLWVVAVLGVVMGWVALTHAWFLAHDESAQPMAAAERFCAAADLASGRVSAVLQRPRRPEGLLYSVLAAPVFWVARSGDAAVFWNFFYLALLCFALYRLSRTLGCGRPAAVATASAGCLSPGAVAASRIFSPWIAAIAVATLAGCFLCRSEGFRRWRETLLAACATGLAIWLARQTSWVLVPLLVASLIYGLWKKGRQRRIDVLIRAAVAAALLLLVVAPVVWPGVTRAEIPWEAGLPEPVVSKALNTLVMHIVSFLSSLLVLIAVLWGAFQRDLRFGGPLLAVAGTVAGALWGDSRAVLLLGAPAAALLLGLGTEQIAPRRAGLAACAVLVLWSLWQHTGLSFRYADLAPRDEVALTARPDLEFDLNTMEWYRPYPAAADWKKILAPVEALIRRSDSASPAGGWLRRINRAPFTLSVLLRADMDLYPGLLQIACAGKLPLRIMPPVRVAEQGGDPERGLEDGWKSDFVLMATEGAGLGDADLRRWELWQKSRPSFQLLSTEPIRRGRTVTLFARLSLRSE